MSTLKAERDFDRASRRAQWRKFVSKLLGQSNDLLPYDLVRQTLPVKGQRYRGLNTVPVSKIVGSVGRYNDFDREFLPTQDFTRSRWVNIDKARYEGISLPPVELYKIGDIYFVKDGNHRVSVARQFDIPEVDAFVIEIDVPVKLTEDTKIDDLVQKQAYAVFAETNNIPSILPGADFELTNTGEYPRLLEHISDHRWYFGELEDREVGYEEGLKSWYEKIYIPVVEEIKDKKLDKQLNWLTLTDLYLLVSEYQQIRRQTLRDNESIEISIDRFSKQIETENPQTVINTLRQSAWLDELITQQDRNNFDSQTHLSQLRPDSQINLTLPGKYERLFEHIDTHRWYLGEQENHRIPYEEAVTSWYDNVYLPMVQIIREQDILSNFPGRTETDLYLWMIDHRAHLEEQLGWEVTPETAASNLSETMGKQSLGDIMTQVTSRVSGALTPDPLEPGPAPGKWRRDRMEKRTDSAVFTDILIALGPDPANWRSLDQGIVAARRSGARLQGLHVHPQKESKLKDNHDQLHEAFNTKLTEAGVQGSFAIEWGKTTRKISERAWFSDLIIVNLDHRPSQVGIIRLGSGLRMMIRRSGRPVLLVPEKITQFEHIMLAYDGSPKSDEALYLASLIQSQWGIKLTVITISEGQIGETTLNHARTYLESHDIDARFLLKSGSPAMTIQETAAEIGVDLIMLGGYGMHPVVEILLGSVVDTLLRESENPLLITS